MPVREAIRVTRPSSMITMGSSSKCSGAIRRAAVITVCIRIRPTFQRFKHAQPSALARKIVKLKPKLEYDEAATYRDPPLYLGRRLQGRRTRPGNRREHLSDFLIQPAHVASRAVGPRPLRRNGAPARPL